MVNTAHPIRTFLKAFIISLTAILALGLDCHAKLVTVSGKAPDYAGHTIVMRAKADAISRMTYDLSSTEVQPDGSFCFEADIDEITYAVVDLSYYEAYIYLEPGAKYVVSLPPYRLRPDADRFNPYYEPSPIRLPLRSASSDLNKAIRDFDDVFNRAYYPVMVKIVSKHDKKLADKVIAKLDSTARAIGCRKPYFTQHVTFRKAEVYATPRLNSPRAILNKYYVGNPVMFNLPAYWRAIEMMNTDVTSDNSNKEIQRQLNKIKYGKGTQDAALLSSTLAQDTLFGKNQTLREMLIVKGLKDNFYSSVTSDGRTDTLLTSAARSFKSKRVRLIAANVYAQKNKLKRGLPAPDFHLDNGNNREISLSTFHGRFLYLCFMHSENYECVKVLPVLENMAQLHKSDLDILCIFTDDDTDALYKQLAKSNHTWQGISWVSNQRVLSDYEVRHLPTYFLIDPDGCIAMAQAPGPNENVGPAIAEAIRQYKIIKTRGRIEVPRTIYDIANEAK